MQPKYLQELIRNLQEFYKCPSCETNYHFDDIRFLGEIDLYCFVQLSCHNCSLPVLATVSVNGKAGGKRGAQGRSIAQRRLGTGSSLRPRSAIGALRGGIPVAGESVCTSQR
jgi:hypothetical protein